MSVKPSVKVGDVFLNNQGCKAVVIEYINAKNVLVEFQDNIKHRTYAKVQHLKNGKFKNPFHPQVYGVGYVGVGKYSAKVSGSNTLEYDLWHAMMKRCYDQKYHAKRPTYIDCTVCKDWYNFQVFAEWANNQPCFARGYQLDKDLIIDFNKEYSPEACCLAPSEINNILLSGTSNRSEYHTGVTFNKNKNKFAARVNIGSRKVQFLGYFLNIDDAIAAYKKAKGDHIKNIALIWQNRIDKRLFDALMAKAA